MVAEAVALTITEVVMAALVVVQVTDIHTARQQDKEQDIEVVTILNTLTAEAVVLIEEVQTIMVLTKVVMVEEVK